MSTLEQMLSTHPSPIDVDMRALRECVEACTECAQACTSCADACLAEEAVADLVRCIALNVDCADVCDVTGRLATRMAARERGVLIAQLEACAEACRVCGDECEQHGHHMEHCRVCAESCRRCERACRALVDALAA